MRTFKRFITAGFVMAMMVPIQAQACQLICTVTTATYTGNLGGLAGADAKCAAEFPGFKFMRSPTLAMMNLNSASLIAALQYAGVNSSINGSYRGAWSGPAQNYVGNDCSVWTGTSGNGSITAQYSGTNLVAYQSACSTAMPLMCCNM